jgi:MoxR-like ATPase
MSTANPAPHPQMTPEEAVRRVAVAREKLVGEVHKIIIGQDEMIEQMLICMFAHGHCLTIGVPGLAKTLTISTIAQALHMRFSRIQFTPDLMPSDITGTEIIDQDAATGQRSFRFVRGPVFANIVLADEINRTPPKTQAALLQAMQEHEVTHRGRQDVQARRAVLCHGHAEPDRAGGDLSVAGSPVGPLHAVDQHRVSHP